MSAEHPGGPNLSQVALAAINAVGPINGRPIDQWQAAVGEMASTIYVMLGDSSSLMKRLNDLASSKTFRGQLHSLKYEDSSTRYIVTLKTQASKDYPDGLEPLRTDRTDKPGGKSMADALKGLEIGTELLVWKQMEPMGNGRSVRVIRHFEVISARDDAPAPRSAPAPASTPPPAPRPQTAPQRVETAEPPLMSSEGSPILVEAARQATSELRGTQKVAFLRELALAKIERVPTPETAEAILAICAKVMDPEYQPQRQPGYDF